jgi:predicted flap endonuclease-1-like 5' DNA nuclease
VGDVATHHDVRRREKEQAMTWITELPGVGVAEDRARKALSFPIGAASPLWLAFGAATSAGVAWWWMTRWARRSNLEAVLEEVATVTVAPIEIALMPEEAPATALAQPELALEAAPEAVAPPAEAEPPAAPPAPDDLTLLVGIGPKLAEALARSGVTRFAQIAAWSDADVAKLDKALDLKGRAVRDAWVAQAVKLSAAS